MSKEIVSNKKRHWANKKILHKIEEFCNEYPELRFNQVMSIIGYDGDDFYEESEATLEKIIYGIKLAEE